MSRIIDNLKDNLISYIVVAIMSGLITGFVGGVKHEVRTEYYCPSFPVGGEKVASELSKLSTEEYPNLWEWIGRIEKLRQDLDLCKDL